METVKLYYFNGLNGTVFFDQDSASYIYFHENDYEHKKDYLKDILNVLRGYVIVELEQRFEFRYLHVRIKDLLIRMEDSEYDDYM